MRLNKTLLYLLTCKMNLIKGKSYGSILCMGKIAASVLLKLFINGNAKCHSIDALLSHKRRSIVKCKQHTIHDPKGLEKLNYTQVRHYMCEFFIQLKIKQKFIYIIFMLITMTGSIVCILKCICITFSIFRTRKVDKHEATRASNA